MTVETFFEKFELFADVPGVVTKMRELVLELAVRGKLVEQDDADGDAGVLLNRIMDCRQRKHHRKFSEVTIHEDSPTVEGWYEVPRSWRWVRLSMIGDIVGGGTPRSDNSEYFTDEGIPWLTPADLNGFKGKRISRGRRFITKLGLERSSAQLLSEGSVLFSSRAPIGYVAIAGAELATNQGFKSCVPFVTEINEFLYYYLLNAAARIDREASGTTFREVSGKVVSQIPVPLPPLAEQKRIVAKVDELMALCDRLEAEQKEREEKKAALTRASLARFAKAPTQANLNYLFHKSYDIAPADLRKTILTLAVQGKLVPQDLNDEPAIALFDRIAAHKALLSKEGNFSGSTSVEPMIDADMEYALPVNWSWVRLGEIMINRDGERIPVSKEERQTRAQIYDYYGASGVIDKIDKYLFDRPLLLIGEDGANLINRSTPIAFIARGKYWVNNHAHVLDGISEDLLRFIELHINAINLEKYITGSAQPKMNQAKMNSIPIALPPLAEQRRIVAKVDQLMALVDALETQ
ncbi:MAG TPA: restriction endonuclease subunit S, partial [bacterium]|nr:restriction endonuclease subunit S [bacterium]